MAQANVTPISCLGALYLSQSEFGYMTLGLLGFTAFPVRFETTTGVPNLRSWRVGVYQPDPNVMINRTGRSIDLGHTRWEKNELTLHPGPHGESAAVTFRVRRDGKYLVVVFSEHKSFDFAPADVYLTINSAKANSVIAGENIASSMDLRKGDRIEIGVATPPGLVYHGKSTSLRIAVYVVVSDCDPSSWEFADLLRVDDIGSEITQTELETVLESITPGDDALRPVHMCEASTDAFHTPKKYLNPALQAHIEACFGESIDHLVRRCVEDDLPIPIKKTVTYFTPRSGSTAFAELQARTPGMGRPIEYFVEPIFGFFSAILQIRGERLDVFSFIERAGADPTGMFGIQIDIDRLSASPTLSNRLHQYNYHLYQTRRDLISQAISHYKAVYGGSWSSLDPGRQDLPYSRADILESIRGISEQLISWEKYFKLISIEPTRYYYEDMLANSAELLQTVGKSIDSVTTLECTPNLADLVWQPLRNKTSHEFRQLLLTTDGEMGGFDLHERDGLHVAVLSGLQLDDLPPEQYRSGLYISAESKRELTSKVEAILHGIKCD